MEKRFEHTEGPWVNEGRGSVSDTNGGNICTVFMGGARTGHDTANADRIVATVNGCDAAGIVDPGELKRLLRRVETLLVNTIQLPKCKSSGGMLHIDRLDYDLLRAALRAVRGE